MNTDNPEVLHGVREYAEGDPVHLEIEMPSEYNGLTQPRVVVSASNEGGHNGVAIDAEELYAALTQWRVDHRIAADGYPFSEAAYLDFPNWLAAQTL